MPKSKKVSSTPAAKSALKRFKYELADELGALKAKHHPSFHPPNVNSSLGDYLVEQMIKTQQDKMD